MMMGDIKRDRFNEKVDDGELERGRQGWGWIKKKQRKVVEEKKCVIWQRVENPNQLHPLSPLSFSLSLSFVKFSPLNIN